MSQAGTENYLTPLADCSSCKYRDTLLAAGSPVGRATAFRCPTFDVCECRT
jgi:hypothetical protein